MDSKFHQPVIIVGEQDPNAHKKNSNMALASLVTGFCQLYFFGYLGSQLF